MARIGYRLFVTVWLLGACAAAHAAVRVHAAELGVPGAQLRDVTLVAAIAADGKPSLQLQVQAADVPALGWRNVALDLSGEPARADGKAWTCAGHVGTRRAPGGALAAANLTVLYDPASGSLTVDLAQAQTTVQALLPLDQPSHVQLTLHKLPIDWLGGLLAQAWSGGRLKSGELSGEVAVDAASAATRVSGRVRITQASFDSRTGTLAGDKLGANGTFRINTAAPLATLMFDGTLDGGQLLLGPLYAALPKHAVDLHLSTSAGPTGIAIEQLDVSDPDALRLAGSLRFDAKGQLAQLDMRRFAATFPAAYTRYGTTLVQSLTGFSGLVASGSVVGSFEVGASGVRAIDLTANALSVQGDGGNLALDGLEGRIDWLAGASRPATQLAWRGLGMYRIAVGAGRATLADTNGTLGLAAPVSTSLFGGQFHLQRLALRPAARKGPRLDAALAFTDVDMAALCKVLGWPAFGGTLGGAVPDLSYRDGQLTFAGGLSVNVFGGSVSVTDLALQQPFGNSPQLTADIDASGLDLAQLTGIFDFGQITGTLDGSVHGLRMQDWKPVAFTANLHADGGGKISQRALKSLTEVGGGGIAGGLQAAVLRVFRNFRYDRIGLSCTLANGVCQMGGIASEPQKDGYLIVDGAGLPHITVIGHERQVDWATLVDRLRAASNGSGPVIR